MEAEQRRKENRKRLYHGYTAIRSTNVQTLRYVLIYKENTKQEVYAKQKERV